MGEVFFKLKIPPDLSRIENLWDGGTGDLIHGCAAKSTATAWC